MNSGRRRATTRSTAFARRFKSSTSSSMSYKHGPQSHRDTEFKKRDLLRASVSLWLGVFCVAAGATSVSSLLAQDHGYTPADIENGAQLYQSACAGCHGPS